MEEGARHATTNVDFSASEALTPLCTAAAKCASSAVTEGADRGSEGVSAMMVCTKSATAACGSVLTQCFAVGVSGGASMTSAAMLLQMFSVPAR